VPKLLRISGQERIATLKRIGLVQIRQKGSHVIMRRAERGCVVPLHRELKTGTLAGLLGQAGVEAAEFTRVHQG